MRREGWFNSAYRFSTADGAKTWKSESMFKSNLHLTDEQGRLEAVFDHCAFSLSKEWKIELLQSGLSESVIDQTVVTGLARIEDIRRASRT